jgi:uncharacterized iron-regulated membrane protein
MTIHTHWLRVLHKWIGLVIGLQLVLWTLSGTVMAILPMDKVAGGERRQVPEAPIGTIDRWSDVQRQLAGSAITGVSLRPLLDRQVFEVTTAAGTRLFDAASGRPVAVDAQLARRVATAAYAGEGPVKAVAPLDKLTLAVREHELPIWRVDFADRENSSFYVSGSTGALLERRNDTWRTWDFFWMLHNMDYVNRTSFNHPMIIVLGFAAVWLAITGVWLLFRTGWRSDFKRLRAARRAGPRRSTIADDARNDPEGAPAA